MRLSGWIFMITAWSIILSMAFFCFRKIIMKDMEKKEKESR